TIDVSIICTAASWAPASTFIILLQTPARRQRNEAIVAGGVGTKTVRQVPPRRPGSQHPKDAVENTAVVHPDYATRRVREHGLDGGPFVVGKFIAHDSKLPSLRA